MVKANSPKNGENEKKESVFAPKKRRSWLWTLLGMAIIGAILGLASGLYHRAVSTAHVNGIDFYYYDSQTGANWTYFMPEYFSMAPGSSMNNITPFTPDINCSGAITNIYALTPGFVILVHPLPLTLLPHVPTDFNLTIVAPSHPYSGSLDVKEDFYYTC